MEETLDNKAEVAGEDVEEEGVVTAEEEVMVEEEEVTVEEEVVTMIGGVVTMTGLQEAVDASATDMKGEEIIDTMMEGMVVADVLTVADQGPPEILPQEDSREIMIGKDCWTCIVKQ